MLSRMASSELEDTSLIAVKILNIPNICLLLLRYKLCYCTKISGNGVVHSM